MSDIKNARELRYKLLKNPYRPKYHIVSPEGVSIPFDPNGAIYYKGRYHLFYILQEEGVHCWGHLSSRDLLHWVHHPVALYPTLDSPETGIFSGSAMMTNDGRPALIYHGCGAGNSIAVAKDEELIEWQKIETNPIIKIPKEGDESWGVYSSWDPHGWLEGQEYKAVFGGREPALFTSKDLLHWQYERPFITKEQRLNQLYEDYSCPDFFPLGDKYVFMFISHTRGVQYYIGDYKDGVFTPEKHERMNQYGGQFFANETLLDGQNRRILWGWVIEGRLLEAAREEDFLGVMSLPRELSLGEDGYIKVTPIEELKKLRTDEFRLENITLSGEQPLPQVKGRQLELELCISSKEAAQAGIKLCCAPDGQEETSVYYDFAASEAVIDTAKGSLREDIFASVKILDGIHCPKDQLEERRNNIRNEMVNNHWLPEPSPEMLETAECKTQRLVVPQRQDGTVKLQVFLDASIIEVFVNDSKCLTQRVYPKFETSDGVKLSSKNGKATFETFNAWNLSSTNAW